MNIEEKLRGALDVSAPPPTTTLDIVMKRGRRRVFARRAAAVLGVVAVVAGIGIGATTLNNAASDHPPADRPNEAPATQVWPRASATPRVPVTTWTPDPSQPLAPGRPLAQIPLCEPTDFVNHFQLGKGELSVDRLLDVVRRELPGVTISNMLGEPDPNAIEFDVTDSGGTGSISISVGRFPETPQQRADDELWSTVDCEPARRLSLPDGTIMQYHNAAPFNPFQSLKQLLTVYRKDRLCIQIEMRNYGGPDLAPYQNPMGSRARTGPGRATLPLTEEQFSRLGPAIAEVA